MASLREDIEALATQWEKEGELAGAAAMALRRVLARHPDDDPSPAIIGHALVGNLDNHLMTTHMGEDSAAQAAKSQARWAVQDTYRVVPIIDRPEPPR